MLNFMIFLLQNNMFPERGTVFDFFFQKVGSNWAAWEDMIDKTTTIPQGAKVHKQLIVCIV